ncbi:MAG: AAA family ATPase [Cyanobacteria bacterium P01_A01_bin.45]
MTFNPELCRNESEVESKFIVQYLLPTLGYPPNSWYQEVALGSIRLDFLAFAVQTIPFVLDAKSPLTVVMEAKHPKQNLNHHIPKLRFYLTKLNAAYGLLTNGKEVRIYIKNEHDIKLVFQCTGKEVDSKIDQIKTLIGRESIQRLHQNQSSLKQDSPNQDSSNKISDLNLLNRNSINQNSTKQNSIKQNSGNQNPSKQNLNIISSSTKSKSLVESLKSQRTYPMKTIAIYHNKGGVGKTTVSINLAATFRKKGKRVLLVDIDSQANSSFGTGLIKFQFEDDDDLRDKNVYHILESGDFNFIPDIYRESHYFNNPEIDVIPSHITLIEYQDKLNKIAPSKGRLVAKLQKVEQDYDIVIIDTPPSRDIYAQVGLISADYLIIPSDLKPFANQGLPTVKNFLKEVNEYREMLGRNPIEIIGVLASKISTNNKFLKHTFPRQREVITERYDIPLMDTVIYDRTALSECMNNTMMVGNLEIPDPKSVIKYAEEVKTSAQQSVMEFDQLAEEILQYMGVGVKS